MKWIVQSSGNEFPCIDNGCEIVRFGQIAARGAGNGEDAESEENENEEGEDQEESQNQRGRRR